MKASIICVGTELVTGKTIDTNSYYLAKELQLLGIFTHQKLMVEDHLEHIVDLLRVACKTSDYVFLTGGLGPTLDDLTREAVAHFVQKPLELREDVKNLIIEALKGIQQACPVNNYRQAYFPAGSHMLVNRYGTAPGFMTTFEGTKIIVLPGPPKEMKPMFQEEVIPLLQGESGLAFVKTELEVFGIGESALEERLMDLIENQINPVMATYALDGKVSLVITASAEGEGAGHRLLEPVVAQVKERIGAYIYSEEGKSLEDVIQQLLGEKQMTLSVAESCTGGLLAAKLTALSGISSIFHSGYITYSNESKEKVLGVPEEILKTYGAVSKETAMAMLKGLKEKTQTHCCLSVTGIAGPGGGTPEKPVGLVYIGVNLLDEYHVYELKLKGNRHRIQNITALHALNYLRKALLKI